MSPSLPWCLMGLNLKSSRHLYAGFLLWWQGLPKLIQNQHSSALTPVLPLPCSHWAVLSHPHCWIQPFLLYPLFLATKNSFPHHRAGSFLSHLVQKKKIMEGTVNAAAGYASVCGCFWAGLPVILICFMLLLEQWKAWGMHWQPG